MNHKHKNIFQENHYLYIFLYFIFLLLSYLLDDSVYSFLIYLITDTLVISIGFIVYGIIEKYKYNKHPLKGLPDITRIFTYIPIIIVISLFSLYWLHQLLKYALHTTTIFNLPIWDFVLTLRMFNNISPLLLILIFIYLIYSKKVNVENDRIHPWIMFFVIILLITIGYMPSTLAMHPPHPFNLIVSKIESIF